MNLKKTSRNGNGSRNSTKPSKEKTTEQTMHRNGQISYTHFTIHSKQEESKSADPFSDINSSTLTNTLSMIQMHLTQFGISLKNSSKKKKTTKNHNKIHQTQRNSGETESPKNLTQNLTKRSETIRQQTTDTLSRKHSKRTATTSILLGSTSTRLTKTPQKTMRS